MKEMFTFTWVCHFLPYLWWKWGLGGFALEVLEIPDGSSAGMHAAHEEEYMPCIRLTVQPDCLSLGVGLQGPLVLLTVTKPKLPKRPRINQMRYVRVHRRLDIYTIWGISYLGTWDLTCFHYFQLQTLLWTVNSEFSFHLKNIWKLIILFFSL